MLANFLKKALFSRMFVAEKGKIELLRSDYMLIHVPAMAEICHEFSKIKGGKKKLYDVGFESGGEVMKDFKKVLPASRMVVSTMMELQEMMGWGKVSIKEFDMKKKHFEMQWESTIAQAMLDKFGKQKEVTCSWSMGVMTGALSELTDTKLHAEEKKCIAKGDDYCEFILRGS